MIIIDVNDLLTFIMENTKHDVDLSRYWFKFDSEFGYSEQELHSICEKNMINYLLEMKLLRKAKPYKLTYAPLISNILYSILYNNLIDDPEMLIRNKFLINSVHNRLIGEHIIYCDEELLLDTMLNGLYISFNDVSYRGLFIELIRKLAFNILKNYTDILENRIMNIEINRSGIMYIIPGENIYKYRYTELEESKELMCGDVNGE